MRALWVIPSSRGNSQQSGTIPKNMGQFAIVCRDFEEAEPMEMPAQFENGGSRDDPWVSRLSTEGTSRDKALEELRQILLRGTTKSLGSRKANSAEIEDIVQETLVQILRKLDSFQGRSRFTTWAMTIAIRVGVSRLRRKHFKDVSIDDLTGPEALRFDVPDSATPTPAQHIDRDRVLEILRELIDRELSNKQREAVGALLSGMPVEEIAARTSSNRNAVYKLVHDARSRLKAGFERLGFGASDVIEIMA